jgi:hypothetical protein
LVCNSDRVNSRVGRRLWAVHIQHEQMAILLARDFK